MRIKPTHLRDFSAYLYWYKIIKRSAFCPFGVPHLSEGSNSAVRAWLIFESQGKMIGCKHRRLLKAVLIGKQSLNFNIKQWAEGLAEVPLFELQESYQQLPDWVWKAVLQQFHKRTERTQ